MINSSNKKSAGTVYAMTNSSGGNAIAAFRRSANGNLELMNVFNTCGKGTGSREVLAACEVDPLASQGMLAASGGHLLAINAGSHSISCFNIADDGALELADVESSGGCWPNSLTVCGNVLYACNSGASCKGVASNITGFRICPNGQLSCIPGSTRALSASTAHPAQCAFSPDGRYLAVSELNTNQITAFRVKPNGLLSEGTANPSNGDRPFGLCFLPSSLMLCAKAGDDALSSYTIAPNLTLQEISGPIQNNQTGTRRVTISGDSRYAYASNTASGTISVYKISPNGNLDYLYSLPSTCENDGAPTGMAVAGDNLYALNSNQGTISVFDIDPRGQIELQQLVTETCLPKFGAQGLAVV